MTSLDITRSEDVTALVSDGNKRVTPIRPALQVCDLPFKLAASFLGILDPTREFWEFRTFDDVVLPDGSKRKDPRLTCAIRGSLREAFDRLTQLNASGAGVFVTINRTDGEGRTTQHVTAVQALFADTDDADLEALLVLKPHIAVESSPRRFHLYWRVDDCAPSQFKEIQLAIAKKYGTDTAVCDLPRVMRLPGFSHNKHGHSLVMLVPRFMDPEHEPYSIRQIVEGLELQDHLSVERGDGKLSQNETAGDGLRPSLIDAGFAPPPIETMRAMLKHLASKNYFEKRSGVETDAEGRITKIGWIECGMALKLAYGEEVGFDLWAETHIDDQARADAPGQWASFAADAQSGQVTIATIIKAAKDSGFSSERSASADPAVNNECEAAFARLAALSPIDYDRLRKAEADKLGIRVVTLDEEVERRHSCAAEDEWEEPGQGKRIKFSIIEPWSGPIDGAELLEELVAAYQRYVVMSEEAAVAVALWAIFSHCFRQFEHSPRLALQSPEPRCGKTLVLKVTQRLVPHAQRADNVTPAALFRLIEAYSPTLLVDEADSFAKENEELRGIINSGHERSGSVVRTVGDNFEPRSFATWGPMMIAGIGGLAGTIEDRSIIVKLKRKRQDEPVKRFRSMRCADLQELARKVVRWVEDHQAIFQDANPAIPDELGDRAADNWRPLFAIADQAGGRWPERARNAAIVVSGEENSDPHSIRLKLLADIREIFATLNVQEISSSDLVAALCNLADRPWKDWSRGREITTRRVADLLREFSIHPHKLKTGTRPNGYEHDQFEDAFDRYLKAAPIPSG